jgi:predicted signal transduction protein with EAL and GGDEF domain
VARLGGDEFGVLLPDATVPEDVLRVIERMRAAIEEPVTCRACRSRSRRRSASRCSPTTATTSRRCSSAPTSRCTRRKEENAVYAFYDEASAARIDPGRLTLVGELRRAIEQRELVAVLPAEGRAADGECARSRRCCAGTTRARLVAPDDFIPLAQQTGLIKPLTLYVIDEALRQCRAWLDAA